MIPLEKERNTTIIARIQFNDDITEKHSASSNIEEEYDL